jgi:hypothetical protein
MAAIANQRWISIHNIIIYLETKFLPNRRILYFGGHFGFKMATIAKKTMDINSQNHNLLGKQISPKSEDFLFWRPFWIQNGRHSKPNQNGRHMVQHFLLPVNIHFH